MIARRFSLALIAASALAAAGCGMTGPSDSKPMSMGGEMNVPLSAKNEVPPNASTAVGTARVRLDGGGRLGRPLHDLDVQVI